LNDEILFDSHSWQRLWILLLPFLSRQNRRYSHFHSKIETVLFLL